MSCIGVKTENALYVNSVKKVIIVICVEYTTI